MILVDTGPLVAAANRKDVDHDASVKALADAQAPRVGTGYGDRGGGLPPGT